MHADEVAIDVATVASLVAAQHPRWAGLAIAPVASGGTDHAIFRLGSRLAVRLPRHAGAADQVGKEVAWLPRLAAALPLACPVPIAAGRPGQGYPFGWAVVRWVEGEAPGEPTPGQARAVARFILALWRCDAAGAPGPGAHNFGRGAPLATRDAATCAAIATLPEADALRALWAEALRVPAWAGPPKWLHGDLAPDNALVRRGRLVAVLDFGGLAAGDPACDLAVAWSWFRGASREAFRRAMPVDPASWARARGWALSIAAIQVPYYAGRAPDRAAAARRVLAEVLADAAEARALETRLYQAARRLPAGVGRYVDAVMHHDEATRMHARCLLHEHAHRARAAMLPLLRDLPPGGRSLDAWMLLVDHDDPAELLPAFQHDDPWRRRYALRAAFERGLVHDAAFRAALQAVAPTAELQAVLAYQDPRDLEGD